MIDINNTIKREEEIIKLYNYIIENKIESKSWKTQVINNMIENYSSYYRVLDTKMEKEDYFLSDEYKREKMHTSLNDEQLYKRYINNYNEIISNNLEKIVKNKYALQNNIDIVTKTVKNHTSNFYVIIITAITIIIAGSIVATEFTRGTIRLLLTRPAKRWKILLSKLITCIIMFAIFLILSFLATVISAGFMFGFDGYSIPNLNVINNTVVTSIHIFDYLSDILVLCIPSLFFVILAFTLSVFIPSQAFAIGSSMALLFGGTVLQLLMLSNPKWWIKYTIIPYVDFSIYLNDVNSIISVKNINLQYNLNLSIQNGTIMLGIIAAILLVLAFLKFNKQDVKNV